jgi:hypothetical protein
MLRPRRRFNTPCDWERTECGCHPIETFNLYRASEHRLGRKAFGNARAHPRALAECLMISDLDACRAAKLLIGQHGLTPYLKRRTPLLVKLLALPDRACQRIGWGSCTLVCARQSDTSAQ